MSGKTTRLTCRIDINRDIPQRMRVSIRVARGGEDIVRDDDRDDIRSVLRLCEVVVHLQPAYTASNLHHQHDDAVTGKTLGEMYLDYLPCPRFLEHGR
ncbi:hypothetical protein BD311DRAFT_758293 [Dichomitus squalens]|uniref:Uncharacterized protein n=1 Tax=Dichomitus squalens TaxID=114155 RepID=A0A4Q9MLH9_9APHY|nr:hypothetical protein BD311DRAFT_758293 [Dichomitus squalens]